MATLILTQLLNYVFWHDTSHHLYLWLFSTELASEVSSVGSRQDEEQDEPIPETVVQEAATKIQAAFRGYKVGTEVSTKC